MIPVAHAPSLIALPNGQAIISKALAEVLLARVRVRVRVRATRGRGRVTETITVTSDLCQHPCHSRTIRLNPETTPEPNPEPNLEPNPEPNIFCSSMLNLH